MLVIVPLHPKGIERLSTHNWLPQAKVVKHTFITVEDEELSPFEFRRCKSDSVIKVLFDEDNLSSTGVHWPRSGADSDWNWQKLSSWDDCGFVFCRSPMAGRMEGSSTYRP